MAIESMASKPLYPGMTGLQSKIKREMQPTNEHMLWERSANNLLAIYANEATPVENRMASVGTSPEIELPIRGRRITLIKPEVISPGLVRTFEQALVRTDQNVYRELDPDDIFNLLGVTKQGKEWLQNHVENWHQKLQSDQLTTPVNWGDLITQVEKGSMSPAVFYAIAEQYNPSYERWYHPLAFTQFGDPSYSAYLARLQRKDFQYPQLGSYSLTRVEGVVGSEMTASRFAEGRRGKPSTVYIHPQNLSYITDEQVINGKQDQQARYIPGATIRTGFMLENGQPLDADTSVLKVSYEPKVTSRSRRIPWSEHVHSMQMNNLLTELIDAGHLEGISLWPDVYAVRLGTDDKISYRMRGSLNELYPKVPSDSLVFPSFGLYYYSEAVPVPLIKTLIDRSGMVPQEFLFKKVLTPLIHGYLDLAIKHGIVHESHGQNVLFSYGLKTGDVSMIIKDLESCVINTAYEEKYLPWIDPAVETMNTTPMSIFSDPKDMKDKVSKRFHHWLMSVHVEPILDTVSLGYGIPKDELYVLVKNALTNWWVKNGKSFREMENEFEVDQYFVRNYLYTNKMLDTDVSPYNSYPSLPFMYGREELKEIVEQGIYLDWNQKFTR